MAVLLVFGEMILKMLAAAHRAVQWFCDSRTFRWVQGFQFLPGLRRAQGIQSFRGFRESRGLRGSRSFRGPQGFREMQNSRWPWAFWVTKGRRSWHKIRERRGFRTMFRGDEGMTTAEYAIGTVAAAAFAGLLYTVLTGDSVTAALTSLVERALESGF